MTQVQHVQVAILGTGFAGLGMAIRLRQRGAHDFVVFERANEVGGTWRDNTYPGCACDIRSDLYSFSFAPNPDWAHRYARQPEILAYLKRTAEHSGVTPHIRFGHEVQEARWDDEAALWRIQTSQGEYSARVLVSGHGPLIDAKWPEIPGLEGFEGERFHSARWNHSADLSGKRVAVIGTGASAIQFVPEVRKVAAQVTVFQRTPPWVMPRLDQATSERRRRAFRQFPLLQRLSRQYVFGRAELQHLGFSNRRVGELVERLGHGHLAAQVPDAALRQKLTPSYQVGCKRILVSDDYYPALQQPNVELVTEAITEVQGDEIVTADGQRRSFDVLIGATGFNAARPPIARILFGRGGRSLAQAWAGHLEALHGTTIAGFPNLFLLVGPNTALGHNSIVYIIEAQLEYVMRALDHMDRQHLLALEPRPEAQRRYSDGLQDRLRSSVWVRGGCTSFYLDENGRNSTLWPDRASSFRQTLRRFDPSLYTARLSPRRVLPILPDAVASD